MESDTPWRDTAWATSEENVEIVRKLHAAINAADAEAVLALLDPEIVWVRNPNAPAPRTFHGHDGMREFQRMVAEVAEVPHPAACPLGPPRRYRLLALACTPGKRPGRPRQ